MTDIPRARLFRRLGPGLVVPITALAVLCLAWGAAPVHAEGSYRDVLEFDAPFEFVVAEETLPEGTYLIEALGLADPTMMRIKNQETDQQVSFVVKASPEPWDGTFASSRQVKLLFDEVENRKVLTEIVIPERSNHLHVISPLVDGRKTDEEPTELEATAGESG